METSSLFVEAKKIPDEGPFDFTRPCATSIKNCTTPLEKYKICI